MGRAGDGAGGAPVLIRHYTDPSCPYAFSAERQRLRLLWLYGEQVDWELHMVVLHETPPDREPEDLSRSHKRLALRYGMPIDWRRRPAVGATIDACRAVVAARLHRPEREAALLRRLRVQYFAGEPIEDFETLERAAQQAGLPAGELAGWAADPGVEAALRADMRAARSPSPASRAQDYKLGGVEGERRYTCPSYELLRATPAPPDWPTAQRVDLPGFRPVEAYEAALANLAPELGRRADPRDVAEVLAWAGIPLATAEVAAVCDREVADIRAELARCGRFEPVGADGYWSPA